VFHSIHSIARCNL